MASENPRNLSSLSLPIYQQEQEIVEKLRAHKVVIIDGPTGCGKTTQLPRIILRNGLSSSCIGVTQPRRIAAVSVARRIAEELKVELGKEVGYTIRFEDMTQKDTALRIMTDGILLQESRRDPLFSRYDILMIDEAHERSLNIDLTLGLLFKALQQRDDLRVIISSATLQPRTFQEFFAPVEPNVPLISVKARAFPVEIEYYPPEQQREDELTEQIATHVERIHKGKDDGHILIFLTGEGMIRAAAEAIERRRMGPDLVVLQLFGRLTREEQDRVFLPFPGKRKVVISTNIAETSITIPGVRYVLDCGLAKIPRYNPKFGWKALREELISVASIDQRAGRAGRTAPGIALRLFSENTLAQRPKFTEEEILRQELSDVLLRIIDLGISDIEGFPFPTRPSRHAIQDALATLQRLEAINNHQEITPIGKKMAYYPLTPRFGRMVVEAQITHPDVLEEVIIFAAASSSRSPFQFPSGQEQEARKAHASLAHPLGDALTIVRTFRGWERAEDQSIYCRKNYLDEDIMLFIDKARKQLISMTLEEGEELGSGGPPPNVVACIVTAFSHQILRASGRRMFENADGMPITLHPSSSLYGEKVRFVVTTELMQIRRNYAFRACSITIDDIVRTNPRLAEYWQLRSHKKAPKAVKQAPIVIPESINLGGVTIPIQVRRKKARLTIPIQDIAKIETANINELPPHSRKWLASISTPQGIFCPKTPLPVLLCLLPYLVLPEEGEDLSCEAPEGVLLEVERNLHTIERHLPDLLTPKQPSRGPFPGWLMMVANGSGGFWYEVTPKYSEALSISLDALHELLDGLPEWEPHFCDEVRDMITEFSEEMEKVERALDQAREHRKKGKNKKSGKNKNSKKSGKRRR